MSVSARVTGYLRLSASASSVALLCCYASLASAKPHFYQYLPPGLDDESHPPALLSVEGNESKIFSETGYTARQRPRQEMAETPEGESEEDNPSRLPQDAFLGEVPSRNKIAGDGYKPGPRLDVASAPQPPSSAAIAVAAQTNAANAQAASGAKALPKVQLAARAQQAGKAANNARLPHPSAQQAPLPWLKNALASSSRTGMAAAALQTSAMRAAGNITLSASKIEPLSAQSQLAVLSPAAGSDAPVAPSTPAPPVAATAPVTRPSDTVPASASITQSMPPLPVPPPLAPSKAAADESWEPKPKISVQSQSILNRLPPEKLHKEEAKPKVIVDHQHVNPLEASEVKEHNAVGISMSVKRPKADLNGMLENAYDALIAGNQEEAVRIYKNVLEVQPENKLALFGLATTYHRAGQLQLARPLYGKLLAIDPHNMEGLNNFLVLLSDESPQEALGELDKLKRSHPGFSPVPAQMAIIYEKLGNYDMAIQEMSHAIDLAPENLKYRYDMAVILDKEGAWPQAADFYQQLLAASDRGEKIPANPEEIQERLTFIRSNVRVKG